MRYRYLIYFNADSKNRPYQVYDSVTEKVVGTFATLESAQAKYPYNHNYTWIGKREIQDECS